MPDYSTLISDLLEMAKRLEISEQIMKVSLDALKALEFRSYPAPVISPEAGTLVLKWTRKTDDLSLTIGQEQVYGLSCRPGKWYNWRIDCDAGFYVKFPTFLQAEAEDGYAQFV